MHQVFIEETTQVPTSAISCMHQVLIEQSTQVMLQNPVWYYKEEVARLKLNIQMLWFVHPSVKSEDMNMHFQRQMLHACDQLQHCLKLHDINCNCLKLNIILSNAWGSK